MDSEDASVAVPGDGARDGPGAEGGADVVLAVLVVVLEVWLHEGH